MKTTLKLAIWSLAALLAAGFTACKDEPEITEPHMTFTNNLGYIYIELEIHDDESEVWIDLNNNGIKENNEEISSFNNKYGYSFSSKTVTIYGKVKKLDCSDNQLTALDVSKNSALMELICYNNQLKALDVSKNTALRYLDCDNNQLKALDVSKNSALTELHCDNNQLTALDVNKSKALNILFCDNNQLTELNVSNNTGLWSLHCYNNKISDKMEALVKSLPNRPVDNKGDFYVIKTGTGENNKCTQEQVTIATSKNWNVRYSNGQPYTGS